MRHFIVDRLKEKDYGKLAFSVTTNEQNERKQNGRGKKLHTAHSIDRH